MVMLELFFSRKSFSYYDNILFTIYVVNVFKYPMGILYLQENSGIPKLPAPPIITSSTDPVEIDEIRRTIFVKNIEQSVCVFCF